MGQFIYYCISSQSLMLAGSFVFLYLSPSSISCVSFLCNENHHLCKKKPVEQWKTTKYHWCDQWIIAEDVDCRISNYCYRLVIGILRVNHPSFTAPKINRYYHHNTFISNWLFDTCWSLLNNLRITLCCSMIVWKYQMFGFVVEHWKLIRCWTVSKIWLIFNLGIF